MLAQRDKRIAELDAGLKQLEVLKKDIAERDRKVAEIESQSTANRKRYEALEERLKTSEEQSRQKIQQLGTELANERSEIVGFRKTIDEKQSLLGSAESEKRKLES